MAHPRRVAAAAIGSGVPQGSGFGPLFFLVVFFRAVRRRLPAAGLFSSSRSEASLCHSLLPRVAWLTKSQNVTGYYVNCSVHCRRFIRV